MFLFSFVIILSEWAKLSVDGARCTTIHDNASETENIIAYSPDGRSNKKNKKEEEKKHKLIT